MAGYNPKKAETFNKLRQQGLSEDAAQTQAGISDAEADNYAIGDNGQMGALIVGSGKVAGVDFDQPTAAETAESNRFDQRLASPSNFEQVDYAQKASAPPSSVTPINYTTTSTETVSGGGSTTITAGARQSTASSQAVQPAINAKQAEVDQFIKDNPSNFARKRQGLPLLTPEEAAARNDKLNTLQDQQSQLYNRQTNAETPGTPTVTTTPNTTTTTQTVSAQTTSINQQVDSETDQKLSQENETQLDATPSVANASTAREAAPVPRSAIEEGGDEEAFQAEQNRIREQEAAPQREFVYDPETGEMVASDSDQALALREEASREENRVRFENAPAGQEFVYDEATGDLVPGDSVQAAEIRATQTPDPADDPYETARLAAEEADAEPTLDAPEPVPPNLTQAWDPETQSYGVWDEDKGEFIETGLSEEDATRAAGDPFEAERLAREKEFEQEQPAVFEPDPVAPTLSTVWDSETGSYGVWADPPGEFQQTGFDTEEQAQAAIDDPTGAVAELDEESRAAAEAAAAEDPDGADRQAAIEQAAAKENAINQATRQSVYKQEGSSDWRVRLQLAPTSNYLYNASPAGILGPLAATNGVIFPYTPQIQTAYRANYEQYDLVHSNYRGVYYKNSRVDDVSIRAEFTAQDTSEANYLLAVIHFFRSVTKMFYGKDEQRGSPPPLVYLSGLGMNQFYGHPCVVSSFQYTLPTKVDYIRATSVNDYGTDLLSRRTATKSSGVAGLGASGNRILNSGLERFFPGTKPAPDSVVASVNKTQLANYVPTKMEIDISLIPVQTRSQVSKQFSLKGFANGDLIKGGFW